MRTIGRRTMLATLVVSAGTAVAKVASAGKDLVVAAQYGRSDPLEAFLNASVVPLVATAVLAGSVTAAFMATYIEVRERQGREAAHSLISTVAFLSVGVLTLASLLLYAVADLVLPLLGANFSTEKQQLMRQLYLILLPIVPLSGLATVWSSVLNAEGRFALAALAPIAVPLATVAAIAGVHGSPTAHALAWGTLVGYLVQALALAMELMRRRLPVVPRWRGWSTPLSHIVRLYGPASAAALFISSTLVVDQAMAAMLDAGSVAALNYGVKLVALVIGLGATAIGTGLTPRLSELVVAENWRGIRELLKTYTALIAAVTIPFTAAFMLGSEWIVATFYQRGTFTADDARIVADVQALLTLQVPAYAIGIIFVSLVTALRGARVFVWANVLNVSCNVVFNYLLMQRFGVAGIAASTALVVTISCIYVWRASMRLLDRAERSAVQRRPLDAADAAAAAQPAQQP